MNLDDLWTPFVTWQFGVSATAIIAVIATLKKFFSQLNPALAGKGWFKACITAANLLLGLAVAVPKDFLMGTTYVQRALVGLCAGFLSSYIYALLIKRIFPTVEPVDKAPGAPGVAALTPDEDITQVLPKT